MTKKQKKNIILVGGLVFLTLFNIILYISSSNQVEAVMVYNTDEEDFEEPAPYLYRYNSEAEDLETNKVIKFLSSPAVARWLFIVTTALIVISIYLLLMIVIVLLTRMR